MAKADAAFKGLGAAEPAFWKLLRAGLWGDARQVADFPALNDRDWAQVYKLAATNGVAGIVADGLSLLPAEAKPPMAVVTRFVTAKAQLIHRHRAHNAAIADVMRLMADMGVKAVLLKGQGVASDYIQPASRNCGDIDIYVGLEQIDRTLAQLKERGITYDEEVNDDDKHAVFFFSGLRIELHRYSTFLNMPKADRLYQRWWDEQTANATRTLYATTEGEIGPDEKPGSVAVAVPGVQACAFYIFYHAFHHFTSNQVQFRQFCDVARFLHVHRDAIDGSALEALLESFGLKKEWQTVMIYLHEYLGADKASLPLYDDSLAAKAAKFAQRMRQKSFAPKGEGLWKRPKNKVGSKLYSYVHYYGAAWELFPIFPKESLAFLYHNTFHGLKVLFTKPENRLMSHTLEHYRARMEAEGKK